MQYNDDWDVQITPSQKADVSYLILTLNMIFIKKMMYG